MRNAIKSNDKIILDEIRKLREDFNKFKTMLESVWFDEEELENQEVEK